MLRKTSQWYAAECVRARCVCLAASVRVCVCIRGWRRRERGRQGRQKKRRGERGGREGGVHKGPRGGWGWKESGSERKEGEGANWASTHTSPPPIRVTHLPFTQYITLHFWCLQSLGKEVTVNITAAATAVNRKKKKEKKISPAWNAFSHSFFPLTPLLLVFVQWFA